MDNDLKATKLLIELCKKYDCSNYISGIGSKNYLDESKFISNQISLIYIEDLSTIFEKYNLSKNSIIQLICDEQFDIKSKFPTLVNDYKKKIIYINNKLLTRV